jgi:hypothetical protein
LAASMAESPWSFTDSILKFASIMRREVLDNLTPSHAEFTFFSSGRGLDGYELRCTAKGLTNVYEDSHEFLVP